MAGLFAPAAADAAGGAAAGAGAADVGAGAGMAGTEGGLASGAGMGGGMLDLLGGPPTQAAAGAGGLTQAMQTLNMLVNNPYMQAYGGLQTLGNLSQPPEPQQLPFPLPGNISVPKRQVRMF